MENLPADVIGLVHYRRYIGRKMELLVLIQRYRNPFGSILDGKDIERLMKKVILFFPKDVNIILKHFIRTMHIRIMQNIWILQEKF